MDIKFSLAAFLSAVAATLSVTAAPTQAVPVTIDGTTYELITQELPPNDLESELADTPWWGDEAAARDAATQVGDAFWLS